MKKGEIWLIELPSKGGREQKGIRPCIILADTKTSLIVVIPLTSNPLALNMPYTAEIKKSQQNNLGSNSIALIFQIQAIDKLRLIKEIGSLENKDLHKIEIELKELLKI